MSRLNWLDWLAMILVMIGGINWGLIGLFDFDLVAAIFGPMSAITRTIYTLVGLAALYMIVVESKVAHWNTAHHPRTAHSPI